MKKVLQDGPVSPDFISDSIAKHASKFNIGAHSIFLGQVRADIIQNSKVKSIVYEANEDLAENIFSEIRESAFSKFNLTCMHMYHSLGEIKAGEISLFVFTSSEHRKDAMEATDYIVERIKKEVPVWGDEILENGEHKWKKSAV